MQDYVSGNKAAWEEAFDHRTPGWGEDVPQRLASGQLALFAPEVRRALDDIGFVGKSVAQFCCNNGRELLSLVKAGARDGVGFDIAVNILAQARDTAVRAGIANCEFVQGNVLEIPVDFHNRFDLMFFTVGALTWFHDLAPVFRKAAECLKDGGALLIHDIHPFMGMLPAPGEEAYDEARRDRVTYPYFRTVPWLENDGMGYISGNYPSRTFTSFSHTTADILTRLLGAGFRLTSFAEYDRDVGLIDAYDGRGMPLSYLLTAKLEK